VKNVFVRLALTSILAASTHAQAVANRTGSTPIETQSSEINSALSEPGQEAPQRSLPDAPIPILPSSQDGPMPCPAGIGKPCALLGGRLYFSDPSHMTEHDKTWFHALTNPLMLGGLAVNLATAVWDYRASRACIDSHRCTEANPLMGQSSAQELSVGIGLTATFYFLSAKLKQQGKGNWALFLLSGNAFAHSYEALRARSAPRPPVQ
jgi:hypothetical protein